MTSLSHSWVIQRRSWTVKVYRSWWGTVWWPRIQFPVVMCHQKSGSVTGWMAAISIVTKMAMVKKCGRSSQRTARASQRSGPGSSGDGTVERARLANLLDEEGDQPAGTLGVVLVGW